MLLYYGCKQHDKAQDFEGIMSLFNCPRLFSLPAAVNSIIIYITIAYEGVCVCVCVCVHTLRKHNTSC